jgi:hypothetical protein
LYITLPFFSVALVCQVVTCAFYTSRFEMSIIVGMPIFFTVCTLSNIPFVFGRSLNFILHCYVYSTIYILYCTLKISLIFGAGFSSTRNMESVSLVLYCLIFQIFVTMCPSFSVSVLNSSGLMEIAYF